METGVSSNYLKYYIFQVYITGENKKINNVPEFFSKNSQLSSENNSFLLNESSNLMNIKELQNEEKLKILKNLEINYDYGPINKDNQNQQKTKNALSYENYQLYLNKRYQSKQALSARRVKLAAMFGLQQFMYS